MSNMWGMDIVQIEALGGDLDRAAAELEAMVKTLTAEVKAAPWQGPDRERFEATWHGTDAKALLQAAAELHDAGNGARRHCEDQRRASRG